MGGKELRLARRVGGVGISPEIVIEGLVFLKNDHQVFDRCRGRKAICFVGMNSCH
jgi:hypothetical protein